MLYGGRWVLPTLVLVAWASVGLGLLISAAAKRDRPRASFILAIVMMLQILFSVEVAGQHAAPLEEAYGEFNGHHCVGCQRRAQTWFAGDEMVPERKGSNPQSTDAVQSLVHRGGWFCDSCRGRANSPNAPAASRPKVDSFEDAQRPSVWAARASYWTVSRYGDIVLRSFAYTKDDFDAFQGRAPRRAGEHRLAGFGTWILEAIATLLAAAIGLPCLAVVVLWFQERIAPHLANLVQSVTGLGRRQTRDQNHGNPET
jgi:hypothetical protein